VHINTHTQHYKLTLTVLEDRLRLASISVNNFHIVTNNRQ